jgi:hypothetical protein
MQEAKADLKTKGDSPLSDAHLHPLHYDDNGSIISFGLPIPSTGPGNDTDPINLINNKQPSMVLGFKENIKPLPSGQIGGTPERSYIPRIGFYNSTGLIIQIDYSDLKIAIKKMKN